MEKTETKKWPSVNQSAMPLVDVLQRDAQRLRLDVVRLENGCTIIDAGIHALGGIEAGRLIGEICLAGLGTVTLQAGQLASWPWQLCVHTTDPVVACLGSQYAGWSLSHGEGKEAFFALGSGPGRALAVKEELFGELGYRDRASVTCLVLETDTFPPLPLTDKIARDCGIDADALTLILTPTKSLAGCVQVASRVVEVALHKLHTVGYPLNQVVDAIGYVPLPPPAADFLTAMGRTNDVILLGGHVQLFVSGADAEAERLAQQLPSNQSRDYGKPFAQVFKDYKYDFYQIDPLLFAPAKVTVTALASGHSFTAGALNLPLLEKSLGVTHG